MQVDFSNIYLFWFNFYCLFFRKEWLQWLNRQGQVYLFKIHTVMINYFFSRYQEPAAHSLSNRTGHSHTGGLRACGRSTCCWRPGRTVRRTARTPTRWLGKAHSSRRCSPRSTVPLCSSWKSHGCGSEAGFRGWFGFLPFQLLLIKNPVFIGYIRF